MKNNKKKVGIVAILIILTGLIAGFFGKKIKEGNGEK